MDLSWLYWPAWFSQRSAIEKRSGQLALVSSSAVRPRREMPFSQKCSIRLSCARTATSDLDLEAEARFSPRPILDGSFSGEGVCSVEGGSGSLPRLPWRGRGEGGKEVALCSLSPAFPGKKGWGPLHLLNKSWALAPPSWWFLWSLGPLVPFDLLQLS